MARRTLAHVTTRLVAAVVVIFGLLTTVDALAPVRVGAEGCPQPGQVVQHGAWTSIRSPTFPDSSGNRDATAYAVDPDGAADLLITNGTSVLLSRDGGCDWSNVFTVPTARLGVVDGVASSGDQLSVGYLAMGQGRHGYLVMVGAQESGDSLAAESSSDGATWTASTGLPLSGLVHALAVSPNDGAVAYLLVDHDLYATADGGSSWTRTAQLPFELTNLAVDEALPDELWGWTNQELYHFTRDGTVTTTFIPNFGIGTVDVAHAAGERARVLVFGESGEVGQSIDGGNSYVTIPALRAPATSAAHSPVAPNNPMVTSGDHVLWRANPSGWTDITPDDAQQFYDAQLTRDNGAFGFVRTEDGLERRALLDPNNLDVPEPSVRTHIPPGFLGPPAPPSIVPTNGTVQVTPGHNVSVTYNVFVPHQFKPIDFYFLADTTGSTTSVIAPLQHSMGNIIRGLELARIDARVGVGTFRDYPIRPYGQRGDYPYRRQRDIGPLDATLLQTIDGLQTGGGGDNAEAQLAALYQTATGAGQGVPGSPIYIAPGQQADYRNVERVVMLGTDAPFHRSDTDPTYPGPSFAATVNALRQHNIKVVGLAMDPAALPDLRELARSTGAVASSDLDCNGDGQSDVRAGGPVVCNIEADNGADVTAPVLNAIGAVQDGARVNTAVAARGGVVRSFGPAAYGSIGLGVDHLLPLTVTYGCDADQIGSRFAVTITATLGAAPLARTGATVECRPTGPPEPPAPRPAPLPVKPVTNLQQAAPPPPAPVSAPNVAPQVQANVQPGMGRQEQQRAQVMMATTDGPAPAGEVELAYAAAAVMGAGALAWTARNRRRVTDSVRLASHTRRRP